MRICRRTQAKRFACTRTHKNVRLCMHIGLTCVHLQPHSSKMIRPMEVATTKNVWVCRIYICVYVCIHRAYDCDIYTRTHSFMNTHAYINVCIHIEVANTKNVCVHHICVCVYVCIYVFRCNLQIPRMYAYVTFVYVYMCAYMYSDVICKHQECMRTSYLCVYVYMYVCMHVCIYVCVCVGGCMHECMYVGNYKRQECMSTSYVCMCVCVYVCMYVWMYVCVQVEVATTKSV